MALRYIPLELRYTTAPRVEHFALLAGLEASVRGTLISVMPLVVREAMGSTVAASRVYFLVGFVSLTWGLMVPWMNRKVPRRWLYTGGVTLYLAGMALAMTGHPWGVAMALGLNAMATMTIFVCLNAYVLDYIDRSELGRGQSIQMLYAAAPWAIGPMTGVWLRGIWAPAPFILAGVLALTLMTTFWVLRLGNGKQIARARAPAVNPLGYLGKFFRQPRLIAGWLFAVIRSTGWWVYVVYLPYFCIERGLGEFVGGIALSASNALLFVAPLILRVARRNSVRRAVRTAFFFCGLMFFAGFALSPWPWGTVGALMAASIFLVTLDVVGGLPFLMSVKPSQRTEMAAVYSSFRDVSSILTPGMAWAVLAFAPTAAIFAASSAAMAVAWTIAGRMHPRLGVSRPSAGGRVRTAGERA
jgi:hypothetical protein